MDSPNNNETTEEVVDKTNDIRNLTDCIDANGNVDAMQLLFYRRKKRKERDKQFETMLAKASTSTTPAAAVPTSSSTDAAAAAVATKEKTPGEPRTRTCFKSAPIIQMQLPGGNLVEMTGHVSPWYISYVLHPQIGNTKFEKKFRLRFGCTYEIYLTLLNKIKSSSDKFARWYQKDAVERPSSPIELLVLGALRYIGRGWTFDDIEESTGISEETHRQFFHIFIEWGKSIDFLKIPVNNNNVHNTSLRLFTAAIKNGNTVAELEQLHAATITVPVVGPNNIAPKATTPTTKKRKSTSSKKVAATSSPAPAPILPAPPTSTNINDTRKSFKEALDALIPASKNSNKKKHKK